LTRRGKGTKLMLVADGNGVPVGIYVDSAQQAEVKLARITLQTVHVRTPQGRPRSRPAPLTADKGYDSRGFRRYLRERGIAYTIPPIRRTGRRRPGRPLHADPVRYATRWIVERTNAWLQNYRRVLVRHDRLLSTYRAFVVLACTMIALGALSK
jgi:transposase